TWTASGTGPTGTYQSDALSTYSHSGASDEISSSSGSGAWALTEPTTSPADEGLEPPAAPEGFSTAQVANVAAINALALPMAPARSDGLVSAARPLLGVLQLAP